MNYSLFFFFFFALNLDCRHLFEQPHWHGSNKHPQSMLDHWWERCYKFSSKNAIHWAMKDSIKLHRYVSVMVKLLSTIQIVISFLSCQDLWNFFLVFLKLSFIWFENVATYFCNNFFLLVWFFVISVLDWIISVCLFVNIFFILFF